MQWRYQNLLYVTVINSTIKQINQSPKSEEKNILIHHNYNHTYRKQPSGQRETNKTVSNIPKDIFDNQVRKMIYKDCRNTGGWLSVNKIVERVVDVKMTQLLQCDDYVDNSQFS